MATEPEFHEFPALPPELKAMVWDQHAENLKKGVRHYFCTHGFMKPVGVGTPRSFNKFTEERVYFCVDIYQGIVIKSRVRPSRPRTVQTASRTRTMVEIPRGPTHGYRPGRRLEPGQLLAKTPCFDDEVKRATKMTVMVDLDNDVFVFGADNSRMNYDTFFKMLPSPIKHLSPPRLHRDHWVFNIRKLALRSSEYPTKNVVGRDACLGDFDTNCLNRLTNVEIIYVIIPKSRRCNYYDIRHSMRSAIDDEGFVHESAFPRLFEEHKSCCPDYKVGDDHFGMDQVRDYGHLVTELELMFMDREPPVEIKLVMDACELFGTKFPIRG
ncbi:hypothetical protein M426DRAFT_257018 [Hypoxylon sp. CI-4A]|nr:hypothetical protein M426DRAFT_257018 [Hypoxylon sp. CI-4A]